jgi:hypothetical protein
MTNWSSASGVISIPGATVTMCIELTSRLPFVSAQL